MELVYKAIWIHGKRQWAVKPLPFLKAFSDEEKLHEYSFFLQEEKMERFLV